MKDRIVRVDSNPPLYFGPFTKLEAEEASAELQDRFMHETGTYMILGNTNSDVAKAAKFNHPDYAGD